MEEIIFNSRLELDRSPLGAVPTGTDIRIGLRTAYEVGVREIIINVKNDDSGEISHYNLEKVWTDKGCDRFEGSLPCPDSGLFWYNFTAVTDSGKQEIGRVENNESAFSETPAMWQLSVYNNDYTTPDWIKGGVFYHIFVDRFRRGSERPLKKGTVLHKNWDEAPIYKPDEKGVVRNNDFFGGDLDGIIEKLPYLSDLNVTCIYLSPIFEAASNHKYDTSNYMKIDPAFGDEEAFIKLCAEAKKLDIRVICDGVFNHTGDDSVYFDRYGNYGGEGAFCKKDSPYASWYNFSEWPEKYDSWWGIDTLPQVREDAPAYREFIFGENGVLRHWMRCGASGWRLDVADEIPEEFLKELRQAVKNEDPSALVLGEVWEDATTKVAYGSRRHYFDGSELDTVMNYPFKDAIINYINSAHAEGICNTVETICENYPKPAIDCLMNGLGTHDSVRILTALGGAHYDTKDERATAKLSEDMLKTAKIKLRLASVLQCTLPGVPCLYYGDEAGLEGYEDPFNRYCYPWYHEDKELIDWYKNLLLIRKNCPAFVDGEYKTIKAKNGVYVFRRVRGGERVYIGINLSAETESFDIIKSYKPKLMFNAELVGNKLHLHSNGCCICERQSATK